MMAETSVYDMLRDRIVNGGYKSGQKLKAEELRKEFDCSASLVRETMFRLSTVGLVEFRNQRGFRVPIRSAETQHQITHFRILLEQEGACLSIRSGDVDWEARLTAAHHRLSHIELRVRSGSTDSSTIGLWAQAEFAFHRTLIDACGCGPLMESHEQVYYQFRQQMITTDVKFVYVPENVVQHKMILAAAVARDEELIRQRIHDHLERNLSRPLAQRVMPAG